MSKHHRGYSRPKARRRRRSWILQRMSMQENKCALCGERMVWSRSTELIAHKATLDHIIPLSKGGPDEFHNTQAVHWSCNQIKGSGDA